jgi:hypothetical protein
MVKLGYNNSHRNKEKIKSNINSTHFNLEINKIFSILGETSYNKEKQNFIQKHNTITAVKRVGLQPTSNISLKHPDIKHNPKHFQTEMMDSFVKVKSKEFKPILNFQREKKDNVRISRNHSNRDTYVTTHKSMFNNGKGDQVYFLDNSKLFQKLKKSVITNDEFM